MYDVQVLHHHKRIASHTHGHVEGDYAVADVTFIGVGYNRALGVHVAHSLHNLKLLDGLAYRSKRKLCVPFSLNDLQFICLSILKLIVLSFFHC